MTEWLARIADAHRAPRGWAINGFYTLGDTRLWKVDIRQGGRVLVAAPSELHAVMVAAALDGDTRRYCRAVDELAAVYPVTPRRGPRE